MSANQATVDEYMEAFRRGDHARILACLTDDVEWVIPGHFHVRGKEEFDRQIEGEGFSGLPIIVVSRMIEQDDVVVAEGTVRAGRTDGTAIDIAYCDVFEMRDGRIRKLASYLAPIG